MPHRFLIAIRVGVRRLLARPVAGSLFNREDGAVAVEFGLVAAPFLAVLFGLITSSPGNNSGEPSGSIAVINAALGALG